MSECNCSMRTKVLGDGCEVCNPIQALEYAKDAIADLTAENERMAKALDEIANRKPKSHYWGDHGMGGWEECDECIEIIEIAANAMRGKG